MIKGFALFISILSVFVFASLSLSIIEVQQMDKNIDKYKYFHLQSKLHLEYAKEYIIKYRQAPDWNNDIEKYNLEVVLSNDNKTFDIFVSPKEDIEVRLHQQITLSD